MKVRVKQEFQDKYTKKLHKIGDELELTVDRVNEILRVGNLIELVAEQAETTAEQVVEQAEQVETGGEDQEEAAEPAKTKRRSRTKKTE